MSMAFIWRLLTVPMLLVHCRSARLGRFSDRRSRLASVAICGMLWLCALCQLSWGQHCSVRAIDSVWEVSTRHLPTCYPGHANVPLSVSRFVSGQWQAVNEGDLFAEAERVQAKTVIYVHGNWMNAGDARQRAMIVYQLVSARSHEPLRFIALSWPSEQRERPARDIISKKPLLTATSFYLASCIRRLPPGEMGLLGYSFGGAVSAGATHLLSGGALDGWCLDDFNSPHTFRMSLLAPAFDKDALNIRGDFDRALQRTEHLVNLYNSRDPILRRFRFFERSYSPVAAGFAGLSVTYAIAPLDANEKVEQFDCRVVGRSHDELDYFRCNCFAIAVDNVLDKLP
jgi:hypothetical protein